MSDRAKRFTDAEVATMMDNGTAAFLARVTGFSDALAFEKAGMTHGPTGHKVTAVRTVEGRRTMAENLQALTDAEWKKALEAGHLHILAQAWGLNDLRRLETLRLRGYPDQPQSTLRSSYEGQPGTMTVDQRGRQRRGANESDMVQALLQLRSFITLDLLPLWKEAWFYPEHGGVRGWQGTQDVMFVALNPSYGGRFPSPADEFLYRELKSIGFENAHLTDIIKARERNKDMPQVLKDAVYMNRQRLCLLWEMDIVQPRLIVAMGKTAWDNLKAWFPDDRRIRHIPHYSWAHRYRRHREFSERLREAHAEYDGTGRPRREASSLASGTTASRRERVELVASEFHRRGFRTALASDRAGTDIVVSKDGASRSVRLVEKR